MRYLNIRTSEGIETVDHLDRNDFNTYLDYNRELKRLVTEYRIAGMNVYTSQRSTKDY